MIIATIILTFTISLLAGVFSLIGFILKHLLMFIFRLLTLPILLLLKLFRWQSKNNLDAGGDSESDKTKIY
ncbi:MAG: hypothetical protein FWE03_07305 [Firmicutes bacterium]|nr:hypothetical protein [Bacillota bacterium]